MAIDRSVRLTLRDGTRARIAAEDIVEILEDGRQAIVHLASGEELSVVQDARMLDVRWRTAMLAEEEPEPVKVAEPEPVVSHEPASAPQGRVKRMLRDHVSHEAFFIGAFNARQPAREAAGGDSGQEREGSRLIGSPFRPI